MQNPHNIILQPLISEQSTKLSDQNNAYTFKVAKDANKVEIKDAVESLFNVHVTKVNTVNLKGKKRRIRGRVGLTSSWKKA